MNRPPSPLPVTAPRHLPGHHRPALHRLRMAGLCAGLALGWLATPAQAGPSEEKAFASLIDTLSTEYVGRYPLEATELGVHTHDGEVDDLSPSGIAAELTWLRGWQARLAKVAREPLSADSRFDLDLVRHAIGARIYLRAEAQDHRRRPGIYLRTVAGSVNALIKRSFAPAEQRLDLVLSRLRKLPQVLQAAEQNLDASAPVSQVGIDITLSDSRRHRALPQR